MKAVATLGTDLPQAQAPAGCALPEDSALVTHADEIARRGYDEAVIAMALGRRGATAETARFLAASAVRSRAPTPDTLQESYIPPPVRRSRSRLAHQEPQDILELDPGVVQQRDRRALQHAEREAELRSARAASRALGGLMQFFLFVIVGLGVGAWLGWSIGFAQGIDAGLERMLALLEQAIGR